ncbi:hypothetical protein [Winogradskyella ouciana]|uniref:Lipoprotein n=1 Tax=Winogradskyella ouciana TaxID=2608631 RepID=A0A7K1GAJ2_9FLAO|nr:hypothetical protein [Winogradskyella ouciana]MTE26151.1 hypothetical protein [Winogradskyella ouciana]
MKKLIIVLMLSSAFACKETSDGKRSELELSIEQSIVEMKIRYSAKRDLIPCQLVSIKMTKPLPSIMEN